MMTNGVGGGSERLTTAEYVLEINLISAQGLKVPTSKFRPVQTYALAWVDSSMKLRTRVDSLGAGHPTWNDKFLFRVTPEFLSCETAGVSVGIYAVGCMRDKLVGTVRFLVGNVITFGSGFGTPAFTAVQVRRHSGRFHGVLNIAATVIHSSDFTSLNGISAMGYRDLMGDSVRRRRRKSKIAGDKFLLDGDLAEYSDGGESSVSSSSTPSPALREWNGARDMAGTKVLMPSRSSGFLCELVTQKKIQLSSSGRSLPVLNGSEERENKLQRAQGKQRQTLFCCFLIVNICWSSKKST